MSGGCGLLKNEPKCDTEENSGNREVEITIKIEREPDSFVQIKLEPADQHDEERRQQFNNLQIKPEEKSMYREVEIKIKMEQDIKPEPPDHNEDKEAMHVNLYGPVELQKPIPAVKAESSDASNPHGHYKPMQPSSQDCCNVCQQYFESTAALALHKKTQCTIHKKHNSMHLLHQPSGQYSCKVCDKQFHTSSHLTNHLRVRCSGIKPFSCNICEKQFTRKGHLKRHLRLVHGIEHPLYIKTQFPCDIGEKHFPIDNSGELSMHFPDHHVHSRSHIDIGDKPFSCNICNKPFTCTSNLSTHLRIHNGDKRFSCEVCKKSFAQKSHLMRHLRFHTSEKPFSCNICNKSYADKSSLTYHLRVHNSVNKPFCCDVCKKQFRRKDYLIRHLLVHSATKLFSCDFCDKEYTQKFALNIHLRSHRGEKLFPCNICKRGFHRKDGLKSHLLRMHKEKDSPEVPSLPIIQKKEPSQTSVSDNLSEIPVLEGLSSHV